MIKYLFLKSFEAALEDLREYEYPNILNRYADAEWDHSNYRDIIINGQRDGNGNIAIGYNALNYVTTGNNNLAMGQAANQNVFIGHNAGRITTGNNSVNIGRTVLGRGITTGDNNGVIGFINALRNDEE